MCKHTLGKPSNAHGLIVVQPWFSLTFYLHRYLIYVPKPGILKHLFEYGFTHGIFSTPVSATQSGARGIAEPDSDGFDAYRTGRPEAGF